MTDEQIIKALECCMGKYPCKQCPYCKTGCDYEQDVLDLIQRQKAEIERLQEENKSIRYCYEQAKSYNDTLAESCEKNCKKFNMTTRAEAVKEFAGRLPELIPNIDGDTTMECVEAAINYALKEMVGEKDV